MCVIKVAVVFILYKNNPLQNHEGLKDIKNHAFVSTNKAAQELFTEFKFHEVQMSSYYYCVIKQ